MSLPFRYLRHAITLLAIAGFIFFAHHGYCYYEDPNEDGYCAIIMRGDFTNAPQTLPNSSGFWTGLTYPVKDLYEWNGSVDWYGIFMTMGYCLVIFQIAQLLPLLYPLFKKMAGRWAAVVGLCVCGILFSENLFLWQLTRLSLLLAGLSLFKIWVNLWENDQSPAYKWASYLFNVLCFAYAAGIRSEPAALCLIICFPLVLLDYVNGNSLKKYVALIPPILIIGTVSFIINTPANEADRNYLEFRKYQFSFFDYKQPVKTLKINNAEDSMIYRAASTAFLSDSSKLNTAFFKRVGIMPMDKTPSAIPYYFKNLATGPAKIARAWEKLMATSLGFTVFYIFCFAAGLWLVYNFAREKMWWYLLSQLWPVLLFVGITSFMKMENRVMVPMMWCFMLQNLVWCYFISGNKTFTARQNNIGLLLFLFIGLVAIKPDATKMYSRWKLKQYEEMQADKLMQELKARPEKIVVVNDNACSKFAIRPFKPRYVLGEKKMVCLNYFQLFWLPGYAPYMQAVCGKSDMPGIVKSLYEHKSDVVIVSKPPRMKLIRDYFGTLYHLDLRYEETGMSLLINNITNRNNEVILYCFI